MENKFDLAILGGGPAGYVAAERAGDRGLKVVLFEKSDIGGICLNEGCIPTKTLLYSAKLYHNALNAGRYGVSAEGITFDFQKMMARKNKVVKKLVLGVAAKMKQNNVLVVKGEAYIENRTANGIRIRVDETEFLAVNLLICTGSETFVPKIPGLEASGDIILTSREALTLSEVPDSLIIIGGGVIGIEFASLFNSLGSKVMVIEMLDEILPGMDRELTTMAREIFSKKGIEFNLSSQITRVNGNEAIFEKDGKSFSVKADKILVSVGRVPVTIGFGLENIGVELIRGGIKVNDRMRTNIPNVFAAGDVTGFSMLAHTASREGEVVVNNLTGGNDRMRYNAVPGVVYSNPEISGTGLTEEAAREKKIDYRVAKLPMTFAGRFIAENEGETGLCKVIVGARNQEVLGVHILGNPSSELIYGACMAIEAEMTLSELREIIFPHPTVSEILRETFFAF
ncbi:MAG TPA: dihydrolipoyl dehydrogenase [Bacteroidales bacterium]|nr:dihydrolipoyl dehydrogenase [Bacteroidales bacterium]